ncbi:ABC transporter ATP-binding protein [Bradyrhizobium sp. BRP22]|uniref:ABC transporter ATP-binding protein n=1 Tax=Bradyrhizobium sp. BRP22 TaxID=2793821 RepID=UPI001CD3D126|nr:ABC transporter ATP-binding protein [Bradyrhizobium sp. BRP22]MCA1454122.1 ABC transporter ATP-binding protein [Bradyrhizobium sp. BRP22]
MIGAKLEVWQIAKRFQGIVAVDSISFVAGAGRVTGLIGPNGSGKTTTMNMITGLYPADAGRIVLDGVPLNGRPPHQVAARGVARTFQNIRLLAGQSVLANVMLGTHLGHRQGILAVLARLPGVAREEREAEGRCLSLLDEVGIGHLARVPAGALSYGDRRRVEISRALAARPRLLLLDEPAAGMNHSEKEQLGDLILQISASGVTVLLIEHDIDLVSRVSDHIVCLNFGREIAEGTPAEVRSSPAVIEAYLGRDEDA